MPFDLIPALWLVALALAFFWRRHRRRRVLPLLFGAPLGTVFLLCLQVWLVPAGHNAYAYYTVSPNGERIAVPLLDRLVPERRLVAFGAAVYEAGLEEKGLPGGLSELFVTEFNRLESVIGRYFPSPILPTFLGLQSPKSFRMIRFPALGTGEGKPAIFLHGASGNFMMECWLMASLLREEGYTTYCPSYDRTGWWPDDDGEAVFALTLAHVKKLQPGKKILLVGLSNGGHGAMAFSGSHTQEFSGVVIVSGGNPNRFPLGKLPALILWGTHDELIPIEFGRRIALLRPGLTKLVELNADHFVLLREHKAAATALHSWLAGIAPALRRD